MTIDLPGGDYSNLPAGYYTSPGMAAVARAAQQQSNSTTPPPAQTVAAMYSNTNAANQAAIQAVFNNPPPASAYVAPTPPVASGFVETPNPPPPTPQQIVAQEYVDSGYTPPPDDVLTQIVSGAIVAPPTALLTAAQETDPTPIAAAVTTHNVADNTTAAQNSVDGNPPPPQTAAQSPANMTGVFNDTAAFTVGNDANGKAIMELVDAAGNLVQWVPAAGIAPHYIQAAPAVNEKRLIGADADGNPVFQLIDGGNNLLQWTENQPQSGVIDGPVYVTVGNAVAYLAGASPLNPPGAVAATPPAAATGGGLPNATTQSLAQPTIQVGTTASGNPIFQLVDSMGVVKQWIQVNNAVVDLINAQTYRVLLHDAATDAPAPGTGTGIPSGGGTPAQNGAAAQPKNQPTKQVGVTTGGFPIYQLTDANGAVKQWIINPATPNVIVDLVNAQTYGVVFHDSVTDAALAATGGGVVTTTVPAAAGSSKLLLIGAAVLVAVLYFNGRKTAA